MWVQVNPDELMGVGAALERMGSAAAQQGIVVRGGLLRAQSALPGADGLGSAALADCARSIGDALGGWAAELQATALRLSGAGTAYIRVEAEVAGSLG